jgi:hypothetical protein
VPSLGSLNTPEYEASRVLLVLDFNQKTSTHTLKVIMSKNNNCKVNNIQALAAAVVIYRENNNHVARWENDKPGNKEQVIAILEGNNTYNITDLDIEKAREICNYLKQKIVLADLTDTYISDFMRQVTKIISRPEIPVAKLGQLVWAPKIYDNSVRHDSVKENIYQFTFTSRYLGKEKDKVELCFVPIDVQYYSVYNTYKHIGHDTNGNLISFFSKDRIDITSNIKARIKNCEHNQNNTKITQLNFVKVKT